MVRTVYDYDKDVFDLYKLLYEIEQAALAEPLDTDRPIEDTGEVSPGLNLHIAFANALTVGDKTILDGVIAAHPGPEPPAEAGDAVTFENIGGVLGLPPTGGSQLTSLPATLNIKFSLYGSAGNPFQETNSTTYTAVAEIYFPGTNNIDADFSINTLEIVASASSDVSVSGYRLINLGTGLTVAQNDNVSTDILPTVVSLGAISNLPAAQSIFEFQIRKVSGGRARCSYFNLYHK